ncbi:Putative U3 small nucleolar RNA-associated protein [Septoria linicola]|uniref:U3 small nucleolar RNA-associated protein 10 n=1 Tax=Septoria linicola TaxID=215465 RepID=A0A9Q9APE2_9PEZI|nr:Putative U3 small nucleolar RNA-associated protein [Septoria linicola]
MATALQQQLAAIAANSTHQLDLKAQKARHSKSLLFEPRDAATQKFDSIFQLCREGFDELCELDKRFKPYARNLFSEQSKTEERTSMTAQENAELDAVVVRFLGLLGGRLLLKPAMKAMEWLVRRFRVQEYNTEAVLFTFLPYHASHIFPTLMSILPEQLPPNFSFLHPYVTSLQSPPRHAIVATASNQSAFFTAFSQYVLGVAKLKYQQPLLLGFWASVTAQAVNNMIDTSRSGRKEVRRQKEEDMLTKVLPVLRGALSMQGVPELYLGSCMVMTIMATKADLSEAALNALMEAVASGWTDQTIEDGMTCLSVLAEEKEHLAISRGTLQALLNQDDSLALIEQIGAKCRVEKLLTGFALGAIDRVKSKQDPRAIQLLTDVVSSEMLPESHAVFLLENALNTVSDLSAAGADANGRQQLVAILSRCAEEERVSQVLQIASQRAKVDLAGVDADLSLRLTATAADEDDENEQMLLDVKAEEDSSSSRASFDNLPSLTTKDFSFLDWNERTTFEAYCAAFQQALPSRQDLTSYLNLPSLSKSACTKRPTTLSFFAHTWTSDATATVRVKALQITRELLGQAHKGEQSLDMQALLPYIITALADPVKAVRSVAAQACVALHDLIDVKKLKEVTIWAKSTFYANHGGDVQWLPSADAHKFFAECLVPVLEDCIIDQKYITQHLASTINANAAPIKNDRKELKQSLRASIYATLASHVPVTPVLRVKLCLLDILSRVGKIAGSATRIQILLPYIRDVLNEAGSPVMFKDNAQLCKALIGNVTHRSGEELNFLKELAAGALGDTQTHYGFIRLAQLWRSMKVNSQTELTDWLLTTALAEEETAEETQAQAVESLRSLSLSTETLVHIVESLPSVSQLQGQPTPAKKQRTSRTSDAFKLASIDKAKLNAAIRRITIVLELVEGAKPEHHAQLLKGLFYMLSELQHYKALVDSELVYLQGLLINNLLSVVKGLEAAPSKDVDRSVVRADIIVDCVRTTSSTQVHQSSLLLMSALASWAPDLVLHSVMPLFTFMSSTILKQGDDYSAHVTDQTVARIIPPLAASLKKKGRDLITGSAELLLSFTAAFEHIPLHRRAGLFQNLVQTLGADESLFAIVAMLIERYPEDTSVLPFISELIDQFAPTTELNAIKSYLDLVFDSLKSKRTLADVILGYGEKSQEQAKNSTIVLLEGLASTLSQETLRRKLSRELKKGGVTATALQNTYSTILEKTMQLDLQLKKTEDLSDSATNVLTALLGLMPTSDFIESSAMLMQTGSDDIRQQVFWSLEQRVESARRGDAVLQKVFIEVLPNCALFVSAEQPVKTRIAAITCIDRIADKFGKTDRSSVMSAAQEIAGTAALGHKDNDLRRISILCLASVVEVLGDEILPILPKTFDTILGYMHATVHEGDDEPDLELLAAGFSFAMAILDHIPWMLSGKYLDRLLVLAAETNVEDAVQQFTQLAARKVSANDLFGSVERTWAEVVKISNDDGPEAAQTHVATLHAAVQHHTKSTISQNAQLLFTTLLHAFDLRRQIMGTDDEHESASLYDLVNDTAMQTVLKLNDATLRPFFIRFCEWAISSLSQADRAGIILRCTSLYSFSLVLFDQLKSLVTSYASFILENAASLLTSLSSSNGQEAELLNLVLDALTSNFSNDQDGFWQSPAHFNTVLKPLVSLLTAAPTYDVNAHVVPAITELAACVSSQEHHKALNALIMSHMRSEHAAVRLAAIKTERALTERLHIDWLNSLPEMLPFISELQEDDEGVVERECLRWITQIEEVTGESLEGMLQ